MVTLGRIPAPVRAPFFRISPAVPGTFRWSGTTILIFTPDPKQPLPFATRYQVTIARDQPRLSGRRWPRRHVQLHDADVKLLQTHWYRRGGRAGAPMVVLLRFNQPVQADDVLAHLTRRSSGTTGPPPLSARAVARMTAADPAAAAVQREGRGHARGGRRADRVALRLTNDWDKKTFPPSPDLVAFETTTPVPPESRVRLALDERLPSPAGRRDAGADQNFTIEVEQASSSTVPLPTQCDPDGRNPSAARARSRRPTSRRR